MKTFKQILREYEGKGVKKYFHGSENELPVGTILTPRGDEYEKDWGSTSFYEPLEKYRPSNYLAHKDAVFMVDDKDIIDLVGSATDFIFTVIPLGPVEKHDLNWGSEISGLIDGGEDINSEKIKQAALNYRNGVPHYNETLWEYLTTSARIVKVEDDW